jgi:tRNA threonylcarbamoyladenosine biosynthesis protein TsaB
VKILGMDTATAATTVALLDTDSDLRLEIRDDPPMGGRPGHTERLLSLCEQVLGTAQIGWSSLDRLAVGTGPGTFTGLRIGIATAHALAQSTAVPLVGVSTLDALIHGAADIDHSDGASVIAVIDARRGEAFVGSQRLPPAVVKPEQLAETLTAARATLAVGDGAVKFRAELERAGASVPADDSPVHRVDATWHCRLGTDLTPGRPTDVQPEYLRIPDAELTLRANNGH